MMQRFLILLYSFVNFTLGFSQVENYKGINIQGQLLYSTASFTNFEFIVLSISDDTLYRELHETVPLSAEGAFTLDFGRGVFIAGDYDNFYEIDWSLVNRIELYHTGDSRYLQGVYSFFAVPYTMRSLRVEIAPTTSELLDVTETELAANSYLKFDGINYYYSTYLLSDTVLFSIVSNETGYSDTTWFAFNHGFADTSLYAYYADSANYTVYSYTVEFADTAVFADSVNSAQSAIGNWSIYGNNAIVDTNFVGSILDENLILRTNANPRIIIGTEDEFHNNSPGLGFRMYTPQRGVLFTPNSFSGLSTIDGTYLYMDGATYSFHGGTSSGEIDSLKGIYSFAFGEDVGTNGTYSTVFGKNTYGDTAYFSGVTPYPAISSFALGRNCRVAHMGVAIGDSAIASYYRNIAIGRNVVSNTQSAGVAMGSNVIVGGATSWAVGHNLTANGHFATVLGTNASTLARKGGFLYGDISTTDTVVNLVDNQFMARAAGGVIFYSSGDLSMGVELLPGAGSWSMISDRSKKRNIVELNPLNFAAQFDSLPVFSWNYIGQTTLHIGPMAQDFYRVFNIGEKDYYINMLDADGVTLLGIKYINTLLDTAPSTREIDAIEEQLTKEKEAQAEMERRLKELYEKVDTH